MTSTGAPSSCVGTLCLTAALVPGSTNTLITRTAGAFTDALVRARYGPPLTARAAAAEMRAELRVVRRAMREELGISRRLRGAVSLRSLRQA